MKSASGNVGGSNGESDVLGEIRKRISREEESWAKKRKNLKQEGEEFNKNKTWEKKMIKKVEELDKNRQKVHDEERELEMKVKMWNEMMNKKNEEFEEKRKRMEDEEKELKVRAKVIRTGARQVIEENMPVVTLPEDNEVNKADEVNETNKVDDAKELTVLGRRGRLPPGHKPRGTVALPPPN